MSSVSLNIALKRYLDTQEVSEMTGISKGFFKNERVKALRGLESNGPPFSRLGRRIVYDVTAVQEWVLKNQVGGAA